jgi:ABC-type polysaccharide/polyol phosphate transport system ATPase subunit
VSFEIKKGETVGIIGKNGAGKSTLLKIITGVLTPSSGHVHVNGRIASLLELGAGFNPEYTGVENIYLQGTLMGYSEEEMEAKIDEILAFADIGDFVYQPVKSYSSGMFARLAFAVAINVEPDILIVDEALSVGDMDFQTKCFNKLSQLMQKEITILFVSHDGLAIKRITQKAIWLRDGCLQSFSKSLEVFNSYESSLLEYKNKNLFSIKGIDECDIKQELVKDFKWGEKKIRIGNGDFLIAGFTINGVKQNEFTSIEIETYSDVHIEISVLRQNFDVDYISCSVVVFDVNGAL